MGFREQQLNYSKSKILSVKKLQELEGLNDCQIEFMPKKASAKSE